MQEVLTRSGKKRDYGEMMIDAATRCYDIWESVREYMSGDFKPFNKGAKVSDQDMKKIKEGTKIVIEPQCEMINKHHGKMGGRDGKLELYGQEGGYQSPLKIKMYKTNCL